MTLEEMQATLAGDDSDKARWQQWWKERGATYENCINIGDRAIAEECGDHWQVRIWVGKSPESIPMDDPATGRPRRYTEEQAKAVALDYATQFPPLF